MKLNLYLSSLIKKQIANGKSYYSLEKEIHNQNEGAHPPGRITRYTLTQLAENQENASLSYVNLVALYNYFFWHGERLDEKPIFEQRRFLRCLTENATKAAFLFGAKPDPQEQHDEVSLWDLRGIATLITDINTIDAKVHLELADVPLTEPGSKKDYQERLWFNQLRQEDRSLISIGSPRSCLASEVMLGEMFGVRPFERSKPSIGTGTALPFYFVWPGALSRRWESHFAAMPEDIKELDPRLFQDVAANRAAAFHLDGQWHRVAFTGPGETTYAYGVIAAQRRPTGTWLVISGISGPATFAAARLAKSIAYCLPPAHEDHDVEPVMWFPVKVPLTLAKSKLGDKRQPGRAKVMGRPRFWEPKAPPRPITNQKTSGQGIVEVEIRNILSQLSHEEAKRILIDIKQRLAT